MTTQGNTVHALKEAVVAAMQHCWHSVPEEEYYIFNLYWYQSARIIIQSVS